MTGHLRQTQPGVWRVWFDLGPDPVTGRRRQRTATIRGTKAEAERQKAIIGGQVADGRYTDPTTVTWEQFCQQWLGLVDGTIRPTTLDGYRQKTRTISRYIGRRRLADLTGQILTGMYRQMLRDGLAARSAGHSHRIVHRVLRDAVRWGLLDRNPADQADPPRVARSEMRVWTANQVRGFLEHTAGDRCAVLWRVALTTGMRRSELLGMRWPNVDLTRGTINVAETLVMVDNRPETGEPKTASGRRRISIDPGTDQALRDWKAAQKEHRRYFDEAYHPGDWVWAWEDGHPWRPDWASKRWRTAVKAAGLPPIRFHDTRHTWATLALEAGIPAKVVADRLGHSGIAITLDTYTHHVPELDRDAATRVADLFGE